MSGDFNSTLQNKMQSSNVIAIMSISVDQILALIYTEMFLNLRLSFKEAGHCISSGISDL